MANNLLQRLLETIRGLQKPILRGAVAERWEDACDFFSYAFSQYGLANILQSLAFHTVLIRPLLFSEFLLISSAVFPIFVGAHASLSRPSSAAKSKKQKRTDDSDDEPDEEQKLEGLSPTDAIMFPLLAGLTLTGLYYLIKLLEDPTLLNKFLNWYFAVFGTFSTTMLLADTFRTLHSFAFPRIFASQGVIWEVFEEDRLVRSHSLAPRSNPLPAVFGRLPIPSYMTDEIWRLRELFSCELKLRIFVHRYVRSSMKVSFYQLISFVLAIILELYFNFISKPWWLTNIFGFGFAYSALQIVSPTTVSTGVLILVALFFYDIYFVFYTPIMVTVATQLDIPAKLMFPRPRFPGESEKSNPMSMLGLGDVVLPGVMVCFALRFDLYLHYLRQQVRPPTKQNGSMKPKGELADGAEIVKAKWIPVAGGWGEAFWTLPKSWQTEKVVTFPKPYFEATLGGYVGGLVVTILVLQVFGHAQPALLYLVPGVCLPLLFLAYLKRDLETLWTYDEMAEGVQSNEKDGKSKQKDQASSWFKWFDVPIIQKLSKRLEAKSTTEKPSIAPASADKGPPKLGHTAESTVEKPASQTEPTLPERWDGRLISFSINVVQPSQR